MRGTIRVTGISVYANHGCLDEEAIIGSEYRVDVELTSDLSVPAATDDLNQTIDYVRVHEIVREEMKIRSKLLEHVGQRIIGALKAEFPQLENVSVRVAKINPPINGIAKNVSVELSDKGKNQPLKVNQKS